MGVLIASLDFDAFGTIKKKQKLSFSFFQETHRREAARDDFMQVRDPNFNINAPGKLIKTALFSDIHTL